MADSDGILSEIERNIPAAPGHPPIATTQRDVDALVRMVAGEAGNQGALAQQAVAGVAINRALMTGNSLYDICTAPLGNGRNLQFDGYNNRVGRATLPRTAMYDRIWSAIGAVVNGTAANPAGNATYFRSDIDPEHPTRPTGFFAKLTPVGSINRMSFYLGDYGPRHPLPTDPTQPFGGNATNLIPSLVRIAPKPVAQAPIASAAGPNTAQAPSPHADLSPPLQGASAFQSGPILAAADHPGLPPQPSTAAMNGQPPSQSALNASPPQGGLQAGLGAYLYGAGAPAAAHAGTPPPVALSLTAKPAGQGAPNGPPTLTAQGGVGAGAADPGSLALGPDNAAVLSRLLAKQPEGPVETAKPANLMLTDALRAMPPNAAASDRVLDAAPVAPSSTAVRAPLAQGVLRPSGQAAQAQNPLLAVLMALRPGASIGPLGASAVQSD